MVIVEILKSWGVTPQAVVGHSSGEIGAAYAAGYLSMEDAIKVAFYRGQASVESRNGFQTNEGMLAVGLGAQECSQYLEDFHDLAIACYNSPKSTTVSGDVPTLAALKSRIEAGGHFARMLHVDHAYHSTYVSDVSKVYRSLLDKNVAPEPSNMTTNDMFSSVSGQRLDEVPDSAYWQENMASPVRFDTALRAMLAGREGANFLIEIGPSGALGSPIAEVKASLPQQGSHVQYCTAFQRNQHDLRSLFQVAGRAFISGTHVDLKAVNNLTSASPRVVTDLPNYAWNHTTKYWHESEASKDWRFRLFPPHDLIGSKVLGKLPTTIVLLVLIYI